MNWTTMTDVKAQVRRLWDRGELLRAVMVDCVDVTRPRSGEQRSGCSFPLRLVTKGPASTELAEQFKTVREWIAQLGSIDGIRIEWREVNHRVLGVQRVPQALWIDEIDAALALIGKRGDAARFRRLMALISARRPVLLGWLRQRPLQALELADEFERLLAVVEWVATHPRPGVYLRQVDVVGVHTKFIESRLGVLAEWLDLILASDAIAADRSGVGQFAGRYGFLNKPVRIRFRVLDSRIPMLPGAEFPDLAVDADSFAALTAPIRRVFVTENETNFLAFPPMSDAIAVFGSGYGWDALARAAWLRDCSIYYWGDIDTHGFAILDQLRSHFRHVESFLMDRTTLLTHEAQWGEEFVQVVRDLPRLTQEEKALYDDLRDNCIRPKLRLEQERVGFECVRTAVAGLTGSVLRA